MENLGLRSDKIWLEIASESVGQRGFPKQSLTRIALALAVILSQEGHGRALLVIGNTQNL